MGRLSRNHPMHPFVEFFDLIENKTALLKIGAVPRKKIVEISTPPNSEILQTRKPFHKNKHHGPDQDPWDERVQTKEFARRKFGK